MRYVYGFLMLLAGCSYIAVKTYTAAAPAKILMATIYDDGKSCPNDCDAHVVFHFSINGTRNAFDPQSPRSAPRKCAVGQSCKVCFSESEASCMLAVYRGNGPDKERLDFTPAFYEENCAKPNLPVAFAGKCREAAPGIKKLQNQINCILEPQNEKCQSLIARATKRKEADDVLYAECKEMGEKEFNKKYKNQKQKQRINDCSYEMLKTGRNSRGQTWHRLLDGACRTGNFVGRDGTDCCTGNLYAAALLVTECKMFFVVK